MKHLKRIFEGISNEKDYDLILKNLNRVFDNEPLVYCDSDRMFSCYRNIENIEKRLVPPSLKKSLIQKELIKSLDDYNIFILTNIDLLIKQSNDLFDKLEFIGDFTTSTYIVDGNSNDVGTTDYFKIFIEDLENCSVLDLINILKDCESYITNIHTELNGTNIKPVVKNNRIELVLYYEEN